jgi:hypothetical protein
LVFREAKEGRQLYFLAVGCDLEIGEMHQFKRVVRQGVAPGQTAFSSSNSSSDTIRTRVRCAHD